MKTCPQCGREIDGWDGVCRHCAHRPPEIVRPQTASARPASAPQTGSAPPASGAAGPARTPAIPASAGTPVVPPSPGAHVARPSPSAPAVPSSPSAPVVPPSFVAMAPPAATPVVPPPAATQAAPPSATSKPAKSSRFGSKSWRLGTLATAVLVIGAVAIMMSWPRHDVAQPLPLPGPRVVNQTSQPNAPRRAATPPAAASTPAAAAAAVPAPPVATAAPESPGPAPKWVLTPQPKWATDKYRTITYELEAENDVSVWMKRVRPTLAVRCLARTTEVFVVTDTASSFEDLADRHTVHLGFDDQAPVIEQWSDSADHRELFSPDGASLARQIAEAKRLSFSFTPFNASPVKVEFDVRGFAGPLQSISKMCAAAPKRGRA